MVSHSIPGELDKGGLLPEADVGLCVLSGICSATALADTSSLGEFWSVSIPQVFSSSAKKLFLQ